MTIFYDLKFETPLSGRPGPRIYNPQEYPGTGFPFRRLLRLAGYGGGDSNPPSRTGGPVCYTLTLSLTD
jgi:hypothetical protein